MVAVGFKTFHDDRFDVHFYYFLLQIYIYTKSTPPPEYEEFTVRPDSEGKLKDTEGGLDSIEELLEEVGDADSLTLKK